MSRVRLSEAKLKDRLFPFVPFDSLSVSVSSSQPCSTSYPLTNRNTPTNGKPSVRNKYIMKRFTHDLTKFAIPQISTKYKLDVKPPLSIKGRTISTLSCSTSVTSRKSYPDEKPSEEVTRTICLEGCRYDVVRRIALELQFCEVTESDFWNILWTDSPISMEKAHELKRVQLQNTQNSFWGPTMNSQKTNHFPGMHEICRKDRLAKNLNRMQKLFPEDYQFYPRTWTLPSDIPELLAYFRTNRSQTIICKPDSGCQGKGIFLVRNLKKMNPFAKLIAQIYIPNPLLIDGFKFDLRLYILITSCDPLRMYIYNEGIARFATVKYAVPNDHNVDVVFMHLTNYSLNKYSQSYVPDPEGSKRKLSTVYGYLLERGFNVQNLVEDIDDIIIKTVMAALPTLRNLYNVSFPGENPGGSNCFEILGFDVLIDDHLKPWLLEVNLSPSFNLDLSVDAEVKESLLRDTFYKIFLGTVRDKGLVPLYESQKKGVVNHSPSPEAEIMDKAGNPIPNNLQKQYYHETMNQGNFRLIYPTDNCYKYAEFLDHTLNSPLDEPQPPISRRGTSLPSCDSGESNGPKLNIIHRGSYQPPKQFPQSARTSNNSMVSMPPPPPPKVVCNPSTNVVTAKTGGRSETSFVSPFNQLTAAPGLDKGDVAVQPERRSKKKTQGKKPKKKKDSEGVSLPELSSAPNPEIQTVQVAQVVNHLGNTEEKILVNSQDDLSPSNVPEPVPSQQKVVEPEREPEPVPVPPSLQKRQPVTKSKVVEPLKAIDYRCLSVSPSVPIPRAPTPVSKNKLVEEWILNGVAAIQQRRKVKARLQKSAEETRKWDNFAHAGLLSSRTSTALSVKRAFTPVPVLHGEEDARKNMLKERERTIRQLGIEGQIYQMMQVSGTLSMEEEMIYNKIYSEEEFIANRNGNSTLLTPRLSRSVIKMPPL